MTVQVSPTANLPFGLPLKFKGCTKESKVDAEIPLPPVNYDVPGRLLNLTDLMLDSLLFRLH